MWVCTQLWQSQRNGPTAANDLQTPLVFKTQPESVKWLCSACVTGTTGGLDTEACPVCCHTFSFSVYLAAYMCFEGISRRMWWQRVDMHRQQNRTCMAQNTTGLEVHVRARLLRHWSCTIRRGHCSLLIVSSQPRYIYLRTQLVRIMKAPLSNLES